MIDIYEVSIKIQRELDVIVENYSILYKERFTLSAWENFKKIYKKCFFGKNGVFDIDYLDFNDSFKNIEKLLEM